MSETSNKRIGANEALYREANEGIERGLWPGEDGQRVSFRCECGSVDCADAVILTPVQYEQIRANPRRFAVVPGHEKLSAEFVVERHAGYLVVEKFGDAGDVAATRDPRD